MFGISVYFGLKEYTLEKTKAYIKKASELGMTYLFTSAHMPEANEQLHQELIETLEYAKACQINVILDVSKSYLDKLDIKQFPIYSLRLDYGFSDDEIVELSLSQDFRICLNASTVNEKNLTNLINKGINLSNIDVCHNFYPKKYTGISLEKLYEQNQLFKKYNLQTMAFIPSHYGKRPPVYEGLPTVETHRGKRVFVSAQELIHRLTDIILFGDAYADACEFESLALIKPELITLPIKLGVIDDKEREIIFKTHVDRRDSSEFFIRSSLNRTSAIIKPHDTNERNPYMVTMDNHLYARYQGELAIILKPLEADGRVNIVGELIDCHDLVTMITTGQKFTFISQDEVN
jgi:uncharacterized protein